MTSPHDFHERRARAERSAAERAVCREAASIHRQLARLHEERMRIVTAA